MTRIVGVLGGIVFLLVGTTQLMMMYRVQPRVIGEQLGQGSSFYLPLAILCWTVVLVGLMAETRGRWWSETRTPHRRAVSLFIRSLIGGNARARPVKIDAATLAKGLKARIVGQDAICEDIASQIGVRAALGGTGRPLSVLLLAGPPGCGKSYFGKCLAELTGRALLHLDMTHYSEPQAATQMFGVSPGYVGSDRPGRLTAALQENPESLILLDEIEKAHPTIFTKFLVAWNDGHFVDAAKGVRISCARAIFVLTSNTATEELLRQAKEHPDDPIGLRRAATTVLTRHRFAPEILDRIDRIVIFGPLDSRSVTHLAALEAEKLVRLNGLELSEMIEPELFAATLRGQTASAPLTSARDIIRMVEAQIGGQVAEARAAGIRRIKLVAQPDGIAAIAA